MTFLRKHEISCSLRQSFGVDIDAACGQLYNIYEKQLKGKIEETSENKLNEVKKVDSNLGGENKVGSMVKQESPIVDCGEKKEAVSA